MDSSHFAQCVIVRTLNALAILVLGIEKGRWKGFSHWMLKYKFSTAEMVLSNVHVHRSIDIAPLPQPIIRIRVYYALCGVYARRLYSRTNGLC